MAYQETAPELLRDLMINPQSVRHVSTSLFALKKMSLGDVLRIGSWVSPNVFISHNLHNLFHGHVDRIT